MLSPLYLCNSNFNVTAVKELWDVMPNALGLDEDVDVWFSQRNRNIPEVNLRRDGTFVATST